VKYYCQADIENRPLKGSLYRKRVEDGLIYEEEWNSVSQDWVPTTYLTKLLIGGDCSLIEITKESADLLQNSVE
jgi:hypothetical protein